MNAIRTVALGLLTGTTLLLAGCGGGGVDYNSAGPGSPVGPAFDIGALVNGQPLPGFDVQPGDLQTINLYVGDSFELDTNSSVIWNVYVNGVQVPAVNNSVAIDNALVTETSVSDAQFAGYTTSQGPIASPIQFTLVATSVYDGSQTAQINLVITN